MVAKIVLFCCSVAAAAAIAVPVAVPSAKLVYSEPEAPAHYEYEYSVNDVHSGDIKQQKESRNGDIVHGSYSLVQPDGTRRIVEYTADKEHGFNAHVRIEGTPKVAYVAPVTKEAKATVAKVTYTPAPVPYTHNIGSVSFASPAVTYHH